jgi:hypothetical protein
MVVRMPNLRTSSITTTKPAVLESPLLAKQVYVTSLYKVTERSGGPLVTHKLFACSTDDDGWVWFGARRQSQVLGGEDAEDEVPSFHRRDVQCRCIILKG